MKTFGKIIIGVAIAAVGAVVVKKATEKKFHPVATNKHGKTDAEETKTQKVVRKVKEAATDKAMQVLTFAGDHPKEIIGAGAIAYAACEAIGGHMCLDAGRKFKSNKDQILPLLKEIKNDVRAESYRFGWNDSIDNAICGMREAMKSGQPFEMVNTTGDILAKFNVMEVI